MQKYRKKFAYVAEKLYLCTRKGVGIKKIKQDKPLRRQYALRAHTARPAVLLINKFTVARQSEPHLQRR